MVEGRAEGEEEVSEDSCPSAGPAAALLAASRAWEGSSERRHVKTVEQRWFFFWFEVLWKYNSAAGQEIVRIPPSSQGVKTQRYCFRAAEILLSNENRKMGHLCRGSNVESVYEEENPQVKLKGRKYESHRA